MNKLPCLPISPCILENPGLRVVTVEASKHLREGKRENRSVISKKLMRILPQNLGKPVEKATKALGRIVLQLQTEHFEKDWEFILVRILLGHGTGKRSGLNIEYNTNAGRPYLLPPASWGCHCIVNDQSAHA